MSWATVDRSDYRPHYQNDLIQAILKKTQNDNSHLNTKAS